MSTPPSTPDIKRIALLAGLDAGRVAAWVRAGLFERVTPRTEEWVARAHVLSQMERAGVPMEVLQAADREDVLARAYLFEFLEVARQGHNPLREVVADTGIDEQLLLRMCDALGIDDASVFSDAEVQTLRAFAEAFGAGLPLSLALELCEVWGQQMRFIAHAEVMSYDVNLATPHIGGSSSPLEAAARLAPLTRAMLRVSDVLPQALHRRHLLQAIALGTDTSLAAAVPGAGATAPGEIMVAIGFIDLSGYTTLTETEGDRQALAYARRLERIVRGASHSHDVRIVKRLGDGLMLASPSVVEMVGGLLQAVRAADVRDDMPGARAGVAFGPAVPRAGDFFGHTVNLAARVLDAAAPSEVVVTDECLEQAGSGPFAFHEPRDVALKGIREPVRLWRVEPISERPPAVSE